jgi:hypothetical protein
MLASLLLTLTIYACPQLPAALSVPEAVCTVSGQAPIRKRVWL